MQMPHARTVPALLDEMAASLGDAEFVVGDDVRLSYRAFQQQVTLLSRGLYALGVRPGDKVAILMGNRPEWLLANFAILRLGAVMVSINTWASQRELAYMLAHSDTCVLIMMDRFLSYDYLAALEGIERAGERPETLRHVICLSDERYPGMVAFSEVYELAESVAETDVAALEANIGGEDIAYILYTSGSTSTPKGVQLQHYALIENMWHIGERQHLETGDRLWLGVSLFWGFACENALFAVMTHGGCVVLQEHFDAGDALRLIEAERCTVIYATPNMVRALYDHPEREQHDLSSLRTGATIGTPEQIDLVVALGARQICNVYGLTETYGNSAVSDADAPLEVRRQCVGEPLPGVDLVIADPDTRAPLPTGEIGEIKIKGYVTPGYYKDEEKNLATFDADGYFLTGDLGYLDDVGQLFFRGRLKEMVKTGGINVSPLEVEEILMAHEAVEQAFVVGLPDPVRDELLVAVVVLREGGNVDENGLATHCRQQLAGYKVPKRYRFVTVNELPLTTTGKVQKNRLADLFNAEDETSAA